MKQCFKNECLNFLAIPYACKMKTRFPWQETYIARLCIVDSVADKDLTKDPRSIAFVVLHFPHLVHEEQL